MAFGEADAVFIGEELGVEIGRCGKVESALEKDLTSGGFEEIATADYFGDVGIGVVDYAGKLIAG
jgi:hypothetical protein